jgi:hypothetical protein
MTRLSRAGGLQPGCFCYASSSAQQVPLIASADSICSPLGCLLGCRLGCRHGFCHFPFQVPLVLSLPARTVCILPDKVVKVPGIRLEHLTHLPTHGLDVQDDLVYGSWPVRS